MQSLLERKVPFVPYARLSGADGLRLSRAAFGVMLKFSGDLLDSMAVLVDDVDMSWSELEGDSERDLKIRDIIKQAP